MKRRFPVPFLFLAVLALSMLFAACSKFEKLSELGSHFIEESSRSSSVIRLLETMCSIG